MDIRDERFHVTQFFADDAGYERVAEAVDLAKAMEIATHYCTSVTARIGITTRVIITDMGDSIVFEWIYKKGVVFPNEH